MKKLPIKTTNFVEKLNPKRKIIRNNKYFKFILVFGIFIFLVIIGLTIYYYPAASKLIKEANSAKANLVLAQAEVKKEDFSQAKIYLSRADSAFSQTEELLKKIQIAKFIPIAALQYEAAEKVIYCGQKTTRALLELMNLALAIIEPIKKDSRINFSSLTPDQKNQTLKKISESSDKIIFIQNEIETVDKKVNDISLVGLIKPLQDAVLMLRENIPLLKSGLDEASSLIGIIPSLAGYPETKTFFFLLENNTELRPTGGFIGTYGVIKVKDAEISSFYTDNVYNLDSQAIDLNVTPPEPLTRYNKVDKWFLRDSNWSPDYPTAAEKALWFYQQEGGSQKNFDGVIAITPTFIESLIALTGDITVDGIKFTKDNFVDMLQYQVEKGYYQKGLEMSERKEIIGQLSQIIMDRIFSLPQEKWPELFKILQDNLKRKQILLYIKDPDVQNIILTKNWGGNVWEGAGDYFLLVDCNLASLKSDPGVKRTINYYLKPEKDKLIAQLQVVYKNEGTFTWKTTRYRSYFRLYAPLGSKLIDIVGTNEEKVKIDELGKTYFGSFIEVEPQETKKILFVYELPDAIKNALDKKEYHLLAQKQAGTDNYDLNLNLNFAGKIKTFQPLDMGKKVSNNSLSFKTILSQDLEFSVNLK